MKITEDSRNYRIEKKDGLYTIVCRSPYGSRCMKIVKRLSSEDRRDVENMWEGYKKTALELGMFKR